MNETDDQVATDEDGGEEIYVGGLERHPFDPTQVIEEGRELIERAQMRRAVFNGAGLQALPMMRETRDRNNNTGYAYEGEELLVIVKAVDSGWKLIAGRQVPLEPGASRTLTNPIPDYAIAMEMAFDFARRLPSGLQAGCAGGAC